MTPAERERLFARARARISREQTGLLTGTRDEIFALLKEAQDAITVQLASAPTDYERWSLPQLQAQIRLAIDELNREAAARVSSAAADAWGNGNRAIDAPLEEAGVRITGQLAAIDTTQLQAMRVFMLDRIKDIGVAAMSDISAELGLVVIGARSPSDAIGAVRDILGEASRDRARTIVRTELGRLYETASQLRKVEATALLPGLKKQWRRSGKAHPRLHHDLADGQIQEVAKPFVLRPFGRAPVSLMYPKDPKAPAAETINCGCTSIPYMASWDVKHRGRTPGSPLLDSSESVSAIFARAPAKVTA